MDENIPQVSDPGGLCVGALPDGRLLIDRNEMHLRVIGPTGSGKTASFFLPTLMRTWRGSAIVHDRKGDFWLLLQGSSRWRHNLLFAPTTPDSVKYNPMARVELGGDQIAGFQNLASLLPHSDPKHQAREPIWDENAKALATAEMMFLANFGDPKERNLAGLRRFHGTGKDGGERMMRQQHPDPIIREEIASSARRIWRNDNERYVGSILATIDSYLNVYADPNVASATESCEFSPADLVCGQHPVLLNLHLPPRHSDRLAPLVRMMTSQLLNSIMGDDQYKVDGAWKKHCMLFALDEFNRFGKVDAIEGAMADMRSYGCRAMLGAQSDAVLRAIYGKESLIFNNSRCVALRPLDKDEARDISEVLGTVEVTAESDSASYSSGGERRGGGLSRTKVRKPIMTKEEVLRMSENEVLISGYTKPIKVSRPPLSSWRTLVKPVPRSWKPLDVEFLPVRDQDGALLDVPQEIGRRNPWDTIRFQEPPPPEPEPILDAPKEVEPAGVGLKGKRFDWKWERQNLKPLQRTSCYTEKIRPPLAPAGHEPPADPTMVDPEPAEEFPLMM